MVKSTVNTNIGCETIWNYTCLRLNWTLVDKLKRHYIRYVFIYISLWYSFPAMGDWNWGDLWSTCSLRRVWVDMSLSFQEGSPQWCLRVYICPFQVNQWWRKRHELEYNLWQCPKAVKDRVLHILFGYLKTTKNSILYKSLSCRVMAHFHYFTRIEILPTRTLQPKISTSFCKFDLSNVHEEWIIPATLLDDYSPCHS